jgi:predicted metal-dependent hydrolase
MMKDEVALVRHARARRYILRVLPDGTARVTMPRWGSRREALRFADDHREWIVRERRALLERQFARATAAPRDTILLRGVPVAVVCHEGLDGRTEVRVDGEAVRARLGRSVQQTVEQYLRTLAARELPVRLRELARAHGLTVRQVSIRNQRSRWGSCGPDGRISLNWRLVQVPPAVRDYVLIHELMHLRVPDHSVRFWRLVAAACPDVEAARRWMRREATVFWP